MAGAGLRQGILLNSMPGTSSCRTSCFFTLLITFRLVKHLRVWKCTFLLGCVPIYAISEIKISPHVNQSPYIGYFSPYINPYIQATSPNRSVPIQRILVPHIYQFPFISCFFPYMLFRHQLHQSLYGFLSSDISVPMYTSASLSSLSVH